MWRSSAPRRSYLLACSAVFVVVSGGAPVFAQPSQAGARLKVESADQPAFQLPTA